MACMVVKAVEKPVAKVVERLERVILDPPWHRNLWMDFDATMLGVWPSLQS